MTETVRDAQRGAEDFAPFFASAEQDAEDEAHDKWIADLPSAPMNFERAGEMVAMLQAGANGPVELTEKDFDKIGPKAAEVLREAGVTKLTLTPGADGVNHVKAEFSKPLEIAQDPAIDGCRKLKIANEFSCDISKDDKTGGFTLSNIKGLTAESEILGKFRDATVTNISMIKNDKGESEVTSTGKWRIFSADRTRTRPAEVMDKAELLYGRFLKLLGQDTTP